MDWSRNGLLAYASHGVIVIVDCSTLTQIQTLDRDHKTSVTRLKWSKAWSKRHVAHEMMLASADASGRILIWNVKSGEVKTQLTEGTVSYYIGFLSLVIFTSFVILKRTSSGDFYFSPPGQMKFSFCLGIWIGLRRLTNLVQKLIFFIKTKFYQ